MSWDDDWREAKRQREEEDYDRWYAQREAERDADAGYYHRPAFSQTAWETYEDVWQSQDADNRARAGRTREENSWSSEDESFTWNPPDAFSISDNDAPGYRYAASNSGSGSSADGDNTGLCLGATAVLMLIVIANLGILGMILCVIGWQVFLFLGFMIGSAISGLLNK